MSVFGEMLNEMRQIESQGFDPFNEAYSEKMKGKPGDFKMGEIRSNLSSEQRQAIKNIVGESGRDVGGEAFAYPKTNEGEYILSNEKTRRLLEKMRDEPDYESKINSEGLDTIRKEDGKYVTPLSPRGPISKSFYSTTSAFYDPVTGRSMSTSDTKEISDYLLKQAVQRGNTKIIQLLKETPDEEFENLGVSKGSILKIYGIE